MNRREELQEEFSEKYINGRRKGIYLISMRFGKTRLGIKIMQKLNVKNVLILYPDNTIKKSWEDEFEKCNYKPENVLFSTFMSMHKHIGEYDLVIIDEVHRLSSANRIEAYSLYKLNDNVLGLTGTIDNVTKYELKNECALEILEQYTTDEAIEDNLVKDFEIHVITYALDNNKKYIKKTKHKQWTTTEYSEITALSRKIERIRNTGGDATFDVFNRMRMINKTGSLMTKTKELIKTLDNQRIIVFGASKEFIDGLGIPTYHGSNIKKDHLNKFIDGEINQLGLLKMANLGVTFPKVDAVIITNIDSNSENLMQKLGRSLLLDTEQAAKIYIITSNQEFQLNWVRKATGQIDKNRITYC